MRLLTTLAIAAVLALGGFSLTGCGGEKDKAPAKDAPAKDAPAKDAPAKDAPAKDAPAKDAPKTDS